MRVRALTFGPIGTIATSVTSSQFRMKSHQVSSELLNRRWLKPSNNAHCANRLTVSMHGRHISVASGTLTGTHQTKITRPCPFSAKRSHAILISPQDITATHGHSSGTFGPSQLALWRRYKERLEK